MRLCRHICSVLYEMARVIYETQREDASEVDEPYMQAHLSGIDTGKLQDSSGKLQQQLGRLNAQLDEALGTTAAESQAARPLVDLRVCPPRYPCKARGLKALQAPLQGS